MRILFVADVFGAPGRRAVESRLPSLRDELRADFCIVNGENAAAGRGITAKLADKLLASGADVVTLGNWTWGQQEFAPYLAGTDRVLRPANMSPRTPGRGLAVHGGVAVINLLGIFALDPFESPFLAADRLVEEALRSTRVVVVDFHAEATSEKVALARYLDGRATAVLGTHTHVQTSDARVLAGGTATITDAGMTGPHDSVIGSDEHNAIKRFVTGMPMRLEPATGDVRIEGALVECGRTAARSRARPSGWRFRLHLLKVGEDLGRRAGTFGGAAFHEALEVLRAVLAGEVDVSLTQLLVAAEAGVLSRLPVRVRAEEVRIGRRRRQHRLAVPLVGDAGKNRFQLREELLGEPGHVRVRRRRRVRARLCHRPRSFAPAYSTRIPVEPACPRVTSQALWND